MISNQKTNPYAQNWSAYDIIKKYRHFSRRHYDDFIDSKLIFLKNVCEYQPAFQI